MRIKVLLKIIVFIIYITYSIKWYLKFVLGQTTEQILSSSQDKIEISDKLPEDNKESNSQDPDLSNEQNTSTLTEKEMDQIILQNFLMWIIRHIKDEDLPLEPSKLQSEYMYKYEHKEHGKIDFKKSSYKKVSKFLKKMKQLKYISFDKIKGVDHEIILSINRASKNLIFHPFRTC